MFLLLLLLLFPLKTYENAHLQRRPFLLHSRLAIKTEEEFLTPKEFREFQALQEIYEGR